MRRDRLDSLRVVSPCPVAWSSMRGDDAVRFCDQCKKNVYNVAQLSRAEAVALIERAEGRVCMQLTRRADGTIVTGDCWAQLRRARKRGLFALAVAAPAILGAYLWSEAFGLRALYGVLAQRPPEVTSVRAGGIGRAIEPPVAGQVRELNGEVAAPEEPAAPKVHKKRCRWRKPPNDQRIEGGLVGNDP